MIDSQVVVGPRRSRSTYRRTVTGILTAVALLIGGLGWATPSQADTLWSPRGIPLGGQVLLGAASVNQAQDPAPREAQLGATLGVHRTYWRGNQQAKAVQRAAADLQGGRVPWVSFKAPYAPGTTTQLTWAEMAAGAGDAWAADLAQQLGALPGPVWVAIHHNPEGRRATDNLQDWKAMQQRLAPIFRAQPNIAFSVILTGYYQFERRGGPSLSMAALWPGVQYVDITGFNPYNRYWTKNALGKDVKTFTELSTYYAKISAWAASAGGAKWGVAETAFTNMAADRDVQWLARGYDDMRAAGGSALSYWDGSARDENNQSEEDPNATFSLDHPAKLALFAQLLARSDRWSPATTQPATPGVVAPVITSPVTGTPTFKPKPQITVKAVRGGSKLYVDVNPNKGKKGYWTMKVQKKRANGSWATLKRTYRTYGTKETRTLNFKKGTYRVWVNPKYGYQGNLSGEVRLKK